MAVDPEASWSIDLELIQARVEDIFHMPTPSADQMMVAAGFRFVPGRAWSGVQATYQAASEERFEAVIDRGHRCFGRLFAQATVELFGGGVIVRFAQCLVDRQSGPGDAKTALAKAVRAEFVRGRVLHLSHN